MNNNNSNDYFDKKKEEFEELVKARKAEIDEYFKEKKREFDDYYNEKLKILGNKRRKDKRVEEGDENEDIKKGKSSTETFLYIF